MTDPSPRSDATFTWTGDDAATLAAALTGTLGEAGFSCATPQDLGGAVRMGVSRGRRRFALLVGQLPGEPTWLLAVSSGVAPAMRLLGRDAADDQILVLDAVHRALTDSPEVSDLRWHRPDDRAAGRSDQAAASPRD
ncbi:MAG: hypothetical protein ACXIVQ_10450 [Acidimicrobiales bacterium]